MNGKLKNEKFIFLLEFSSIQIESKALNKFCFDQTMTTKTIKTILFASLIAAMILPFSVMEFTHAESLDENTKQNTLTDKPNIPLAPTDRGCYFYSTDETKYADGKSKWIETECTSEEKAALLPRPDIGGSNGVRGLADSTDDLQTYGLVDVEFTDFTGLTDSGTNGEEWSIQTNTNQWQIGGSGDWYIVQFTFQEDEAAPAGADSQACVWQINVSQQDYDPTCIETDAQTLSDDYHASVEGKVLTNGDLQVQFCEIDVSTACWVKTVNDDNDLEDNWTDNSGTILGLGASSSADFDTPTDVTTKVKTGPAQAGTNLLDTSTAEENNLDYDNSSTSCAFSICTRTADASN